MSSPWTGIFLGNEEANLLRSIMTTQGSCPGEKKLLGGANLPWLAPFVRVDGQWTVCEPKNKWPTPCNVISLGINDDWTFDEDMVNAGCEVWAYDHTISGINTKYPDKLHWFKIGVAPTDQDILLSIPTMMAKNNIQILDILKMDVEGAEWDTFEELLKSHFLKERVRQITLEIHLWSEDCRDKKSCSTLVTRWNRILQGLKQEGFVLYDYHTNPVSSLSYFEDGSVFLCCYELAMYNTNLWV